jgi:hypothetical protein
MYSTSRPGRFLAVALCAFVLTGCASMKVSSYTERGVDFTRYHTYNWEPAASLSTGDPRLDNNPFFQERVEADVEKQLATRGFEKTTSGTPDLLIRYHASVRQRLDVNGADRDNGPCRGDDCRPYVYDKGGLVLDLVDTRTNRLVWRGWAEGSVDAMIDNQEWMEQKIDEVVARILERLPSRL